MSTLDSMKKHSFLEKTEYVFYPQHAAVTEREFLDGLLLEDPEDYVTITTFNEVDFSKEGVYEIVVGLQHLKTKKNMMRHISLIVHSSALGESFLKNGYWRTYGFILEGHLHKTVLDLRSKNDVHYSVLLVNTFNQVVHRFEARAQNWFNRLKYDSYQLLIPNGVLEKLDVGVYRLHVEALEKSSGARVTSEVIEHNRKPLRALGPGIDTITKDIESRPFGKNMIHWQTKSSGEVHMIVSTI